MSELTFVSEAAAGQTLIGGTFCVQGGTVFTSGGKAIDINSGTTWDFVKRGTLGAADAQKAAQLQNVLAAGNLRCDPTSLGMFLYVLMPDKIYGVTPLTRP